MNETEEKTPPTIEERKTPKTTPKDLATQYMKTQQDMADAKDTYSHYMKLISQISLGKSMLSDKHKELKEEANVALKTRSNFPGTHTMEISGGVCRFSGSNMGTVKVRPEEFKYGEHSMLTQQANALIPLLIGLNGRILEALIEEKKISIAKYNLDNVLNTAFEIFEKEELNK